MFRWLFALALGAACLVSDATAARAAEAGGGGQDNIFELRLDLGLWTLVVFLALLFILKRYAWGPILEGLQKREHSIRAALADAQSARQEANTIRAELQRQLDRAAEKVREIMDAARKDAEHTTQDMLTKARADIQADRDRLRKEIDTARDQALQDIYNHSAHLATMIAAKAIRRELTNQDQRRLVDDALGELRQAGHDWRQQGGL